MYLCDGKIDNNYKVTETITYCLHVKAVNYLTPKTQWNDR